MAYISDQMYWASSAALALAVLIKFIIYPAFFSPLAKIPSAHPLAPFTSAWIQLQRCRNKEFQCIEAAFKSKGPYVRLGPNEIAVNSKEGFQSIYGVGAKNYDRHMSYEFFITHGSHNMFASLDRNEHLHRRRRIAPLYTRTFMRSSPHMRAIFHTILLKRLMPLLWKTSETESDSVDVLPIMFAYALDFVTAFSFGIAEGHNLIEDTKARSYWISLFVGIMPSNSLNLLSEYPRITETLYKLGVPVVPSNYHESKRISEDWSTEMVKRAELRLQQSLASGKPFPQGDFPLLYEAVRAGIVEDNGFGKDFTPNHEQEMELASECFDVYVAAGDTLGICVSQLLYQLSRHSDVQEQLRREVLSIKTTFAYEVDRTPEEMMSISDDLYALPLLNAVIKETMRLRNNPANMDPRVTPPGQRSDIGPYKNLPPGIRVGGYAYLLHRDESQYLDPLTWNPYRWIGERADSTAEGGQAYFAFGGGSRGCIGQNIAYELIRNMLAAIFTNFRTTVADDSLWPGDRGMVVGDKEKIFIKFQQIRPQVPI